MSFGARVVGALRRLDTQERAPDGKFGSGGGADRGHADRASKAADDATAKAVASRSSADFRSEARAHKAAAKAHDLVAKDPASSPAEREAATTKRNAHLEKVLQANHDAMGAKLLRPGKR